MTLTPLSPVPLASSASATSSTQNTSLTIAGIASSATVPSTIPTEACPMPQSMPQSNPPPTARPLPGSLVVLATSPFQSHTYSASPSPSPSTRTTPPLVYPVNSAQVTPPTHGPQTCQSSLTSHWGNCHPNWSTMLSPPPTWIHPCSAPLSTPSSRLRTATISNISARSAPRMKNTRLRSTSSKKTSSTPSHVSSIIRRPLSKLQMGMSLTIGSPRSPSPLGRGPTSQPNGSNNSTMDVLRGIASTTAQGFSLMSRRSTQPHRTQLSTRQK